MYTDRSEISLRFRQRAIISRLPVFSTCQSRRACSKARPAYRQGDLTYSSPTRQRDVAGWLEGTTMAPIFSR
jgi:hypothetical protein